MRLIAIKWNNCINFVNLYNLLIFSLQGLLIFNGNIMITNKISKKHFYVVVNSFPQRGGENILSPHNICMKLYYNFLNSSKTMI